MCAETPVESGRMRPENAENEVQRWECDVCHVATFADYDDACRHEEACKEIQAAATISNDTRLQERLSKQNSAVTKKIEAKPPPKTAPVHAFFMNSATRQTFGSNSVTDPSLSREPARKRKSPKAPVSVDAGIIQIDSDDDDIQAKKQKKQKSKSNCKTMGARSAKKFFNLSQSSSESSTSSGEKKSKIAVAAIFGAKSRKEILAEQRAIEQAAKRRVEERERQQNRPQIAKPKKIIAIAPKKPVPERFPVPSHVVGVPETTTIEPYNCSGAFTKARLALCRTTRHPSGAEKMPIDTKSSFNLRGPEIAPDKDPIFELLSSVLKPPKAIEVDDHRLWTEKYRIQSIPYDISGASNKRIAEGCITFVDDWKLERQKAHERRAEKQEKLARGKKKRNKKIQQCDALNWDDSDEELSLPAVCLLTGPVGSGKSSLVHAVAKHCECKVMEINTTGKRGSQNLKNAIEEATQSDSTFDLLKNHGTPSLFGKQQQLVDTDDEDEESRAGSAVPVILIDEVDMLFEDHGDAGFWSALKSLSKKAKCPIFLTANTMPVALSLSTRFKSYVLERPRPRDCVDKIWQVIKSERFVRNKFIESSEVKHVMSTFTELCGCDIRRMIQVLQLFSKCRNVEQANLSPLAAVPTLQVPNLLSANSSPVITGISPTVVPVGEQTLLKIIGSHFHNLPCNFIVSVGNQKCHATKVLNDHTILAVCPPFSYPKELDRFGILKESGRRSLSCRHPVVKIDTAPLTSDLKHGMKLLTQKLYDGTQINSVLHWTIEYSFPDYLTRDRDDMSDNECDSKIESVVPMVDERPVTQMELDYRKNQTESAIAMIEEFEMNFGNGVIASEETADRESDEMTTMRAHTNIIEPEGEGHENLRMIDELSRLADNLHFQSDIILMEQSQPGLPLLAGACRGFGSVLVDGLGVSNSVDTHKLCRNDNAKPPSNERIFLNGWNEDGYFFGDSDAYMTNPCSRQRKLLSHSALSERGCSLTLSHQSPDSEESGDEVTIDPSDDKYFTSLPNEDAFIVRDTPLATLPSLMRHLLDGRLPIHDIENRLLPGRTEHTLRGTNTFLGRLWHSANLSEVFACGVTRLSDPVLVLAGEQRDDRVILDYAPMLSNICVFEKSAITATLATTDSEPVPRRSTRRSQSNLRDHYFAKINPTLDEQSSRRMGEERIECFLQY